MKLFSLLIALLTLLPYSTAVFAVDHPVSQGSVSAEESVFQGIVSPEDSVRHQSMSDIRTGRYSAIAVRVAEALLNSKESSKQELNLQALSAFPGDSGTEAWITVLKKSESFILKQKAIEVLGGANDRRAVVVIAGELNSRFRSVRYAAARALSSGRDDRVYPFVLGLAEDKSPVKRIYALEALNELYDDRFYPVLNALLNDSNKSVRIYSAECVRKNNVENAFPVLRKMASSDPDKEARSAAINTLGTLRDSGALYVLLNCLDEADRDVRYAAAEALYSLSSSGSLSRVTNRLVKEDDSEIRYILLGIILKIGRPGFNSGVYHVLKNDPEFRLRERAAYIAGEVSEARGVYHLRDALKDRDYRVRAEAAHSLGRFSRSEAAVSALLEALRDDSVRYVRSSALFALMDIDNKKTIPGIFEVYRTEKDPVFRMVLAEALASLLKKHI